MQHIQVAVGDLRGFGLEFWRFPLSIGQVQSGYRAPGAERILLHGHYGFAKSVFPIGSGLLFVLMAPILIASTYS